LTRSRVFVTFFLHSRTEAPHVTLFPYTTLFRSTVDDLKRAAAVMETLYTHAPYAAHLKRRGNKQTIMLGFSDSTKDGGYLMANRSEEHTSELQSRFDLVCRLLLEKKNNKYTYID